MKEDRKKDKGIYYERHHIVPRCMGGNNEKSNIVLLTAKEHYICHRLLCEIYPKNSSLFFAYKMMATMKNSSDNERNYRITAREYSRIREQAAEHLSKINTGKVVSAEARERNRAAHLGIKYGPCPEEKKRKISKALKGRKLTPEHIEMIRKTHKNNPKCTGRASTTEKELERREKIKRSWTIRNTLKQKNTK